MNPNVFVLSAQAVPTPRIIYGTAWKEERTADLVELAIRQGFRGLDTACQPKHYHEPGVGEGLARCLGEGLIQRHEIYLQTKFTPFKGQDPDRLPYDPNASLAEQVAQSFETSKGNLRSDYVDGLVLHSPLADESELHEVWQAMERIFDAGGARQLGLSNCYKPETLEALYRWARVKPAAVQNRFYAETAYDTLLRTFCRENKILYQSFWSLTANRNVLEHPELKALAEGYGRTVAQVFFRYLTQIGIIPLTGTTSQRHMREDLDIWEFELTSDECSQVERLLEH